MSINDLLNDVHTDDDGVQRDQYGRYLIPDPETGEIKPWTRATTLSGILDDVTALETWKTRKLMYGIGRREDLFALAASVSGTDDAEDKKTLDYVITTAEDAGGGNVKSNLGTAMHGFTQRLDLGEEVVAPAQWYDDVLAYQRALKEYGLWPHERFVEKVVLIPALGAAGTVDRLYMGDGWELPRIGDLKTGKVDGKGLSFAIQEAEYAHATHIWDPKAKTLAPMPAVDQERGLIIHLPIGEGRCEIWETDLVLGWKYAQLAVSVQEGRSNKGCCWPLSKWEEPKPILTPVPKEVPSVTGEPQPSEPSEPVRPSQRFDEELPRLAKNHEWIRTEENLPLRFEWAKRRVAYVMGAGDSAIDNLVDVWSQACADIPVFKKGGPRTHAEVDRVAGACAVVEMKHSLPFFDETDPGITTTNHPLKELLPT